MATNSMTTLQIKWALTRAEGHSDGKYLVCYARKGALPQKA